MNTQQKQCRNAIIDNDVRQSGNQERKLLDNTRYFRQKLKEMNFIIYGNDDVAVISVLTFYMTRGVLFSCEALKRGLAVIAAG
jgi:serine palmitoyltransferase